MQITSMPPILYHPLNPIVWLILKILDLYLGIIWAWFILSWLITLKIVNRNQLFVQKLDYALFKLTFPPLNRIRRYLPNLGGIDVSPIILILGIYFIQYTVVYYFT